ncbi:MAG: ammonium transporter [Actinomycetota bacterium]|nr:MAG: ammonium transporter [Actinomycetota bacterium]
MELNSGDTAWVLASAALVLLMTPGLAFFYGGMTRSKSVLNMMMMSFVTIGIVSVLWVIYGYSLAFGDSGSKFYGAFELSHLGAASGQFVNNGGQYPIPELAFAAFQLMFAIITPALISGAIADRAKFLTWGIFVALWVSIVYFPVAHWVFDFGTVVDDGDPTGKGWLADLGVLDFAGGTAVHINAGAAGLALAIVLGRRVGWPRTPMKPHNLTLVLLGSGLLWFGWFGFNAGSALGATDTAAVALLNTQVCTAAAVMGWLLVEKIRDGHPTSLGAASGAVAGLVAITPACAFVAPWAAVVLGVLAGAICALAVSLKYKIGYDDSLDVVGVHLVGGIIGSLFIGFFATTQVNSLGFDGVFYGGGEGGGWELLYHQFIGVISVLAYSFIATLIIGFILHKTLGFRVSEEDEVNGIDLVEHAEGAYDFTGVTGGTIGHRESVEV